MRILQVSSFMPPHPGGLELVVQNLVDGLRERGHELCWIASAAPCEPGVDGHRIRVAAWKQLEERLHVPLPFWGLRGYAELARKVRWADVVHVHDCVYPCSAAASLLAKLHGRPLVITQHIATVPYTPILNAAQQLGYRTLGRAVLSACDRVVTYSRHVEPYFASVGVTRRFELVPLGFDGRFAPPTPAQRLAARDKRKLPREGKLVLFAGRLVPKKGIEHVVAVQRALAQEGVSLLVAGDGALAGLLDRLPHTFHFPQVPYAEMHELFGLADVLLLPSHGEGLPLTLQEAMLTGLPAVVSTDPSYTKNVRNAPGVWLSEPGEALIQSVRQALSSQPDRQAIAAWAREHWDQGRFIRSYERIYSELAATQHAHA